MEARFVGDPRTGGEGRSPITLWGFTFVKDGDFVDVGGEERFARHTHFETRGEAAVEAISPPETVAGPSYTEVKAELDALKIPYDKRVKNVEALSKVLAEGKAKIIPVEPAPAAADPVADDYRAELIAQLDGLAVEYDPQASNETLEAALDAATAPEGEA